MRPHNFTALKLQRDISNKTLHRKETSDTWFAGVNPFANLMTSRFKFGMQRSVKPLADLSSDTSGKIGARSNSVIVAPTAAQSNAHIGLN